jgi:HSP20 family protein
MIMTSVLPWRASHFLDDARKEVDDVFRRVFGKIAEDGEELAVPAEWSPRVDVSETDKAITVKADLPGVDPKDVDVTVRDGVLTIKGEKKEEREEKKKNYQRMERFCGKFYRAISLPTGVDEDNIAAATAKGVVTVTIPKKPEAQPKKIAVKTEV